MLFVLPAGPIRYLFYHALDPRLERARKGLAADGCIETTAPGMKIRAAAWCAPPLIDDDKARLVADQARELVLVDRRAAADAGADANAPRDGRAQDFTRYRLPEGSAP